LDAGNSVEPRRLKDDLKVFVAVPWLYGEIYPSCLEHVQRLECPGVEVMPAFYEEPRVKWKPPVDPKDIEEKFGPSATCVNKHINKFSEIARKEKATHMLMVDADMELPPHALYELLKLDVDIASGVTFGHQRTNITTAGQWFPKPRPKAKKSYPYYRFLKPEEILGKVLTSPPMKLATGAFCMLTKRRVFERHHPKVAPLRFRWNPPQKYGIDLTFWNDARLYGFTSAINGNIVCGHLPEHPLDELEARIGHSNLD